MYPNKDEIEVQQRHLCILQSSKSHSKMYKKGKWVKTLERNFIVIVEYTMEFYHITNTRKFSEIQ